MIRRSSRVPRASVATGAGPEAVGVAYRDAGGFGTQEAAALFDLLTGRPDRASKSLDQLYESQGEFRLRNLALGALHAALLPAGSP